MAGPNHQPATRSGAPITHAIFGIHLASFLVLVIGENAWWHGPTLDVAAVPHTFSLLSSHPWTLLTHLLIHRHPLEFVLTSAILLLVGPPLERRLKPLRFLSLYLISAVLVALGHLTLLHIHAVQGLLLTGSLGAACSLLAAYLLVLGPHRAVGNTPFPAVYVLISVTLIALTVVVHTDSERALQRDLRTLRAEAYQGENPSAPRLALLDHAARLETRRPDTYAHLLGLILGGLALTTARLLGSNLERRRLQREISTLQHVVDTRARVETLLEKISHHGLDALSRQERRFLRKASRFYHSDRLTPPNLDSRA